MGFEPRLRLYCIVAGAAVVLACGSSQTPIPTYTPVQDQSTTLWIELATATARAPKSQVDIQHAASPSPTAAPSLTIAPSTPSESATESLPFSGTSQARVVRVIDGDTVDVVFEVGIKDGVRLLGVDTPETFVPNKPYEFDDITDTVCLDYWGEVAIDEARSLLEGQTVTVFLDPQAGLRGPFGRLLGYIHVEGEDFNAMLVEEGLARVYTEGESSREDEYLELQAQAQAEGKGLWRCGSTPVGEPPLNAEDTLGP